MYRTAKGEEIFIIDGHTHYWDGRKENISGTSMASSSSTASTITTPRSAQGPGRPKEKFDKYGAEQMYQDLFVDGSTTWPSFSPPT